MDDKHFMQHALAARRQDHEADPGTGAALVSPDLQEVCTGTAGLPVGLESLYAGVAALQSYQEFKDFHCIHAELDAVVSASRNLHGWTAYVTRFPCGPCASALIQAGIRRVVAFPPDCDSRWFNSQVAALDAFNAAKVDIDLYDEDDHR